MRGYNYSTVSDLQPWPDDQPGFCMLEWDIALDRRERDLFAARAAQHPERVLVAPYWRPFPPGLGLPDHDGKIVQIHRAGGRPVSDGSPTCELFGLGCVYLPQKVLAAWWESDWPGSAGAFTDVSFSQWHFDTIGPCEIDWTTHPQHLHGD